VAEILKKFETEWNAKFAGRWARTA